MKLQSFYSALAGACMEIIGASREKDNICNALGVEFGAFIREKEAV